MDDIPLTLGWCYHTAHDPTRSHSSDALMVPSAKCT